VRVVVESSYRVAAGETVEDVFMQCGQRAAVERPVEYGARASAGAVPLRSKVAQTYTSMAC
jgi:hypothetical protein